MRKNAVRLAIERYLKEHERDTGIVLPLPTADLALVFHALGNGLALEAVNQPNEVCRDLYGQFVALLLTLLEQRPEQSDAQTQPLDQEPRSARQKEADANARR